MNFHSTEMSLALPSKTLNEIQVYFKLSNKPFMIQNFSGKKIFLVSKDLFVIPHNLFMQALVWVTNQSLVKYESQKNISKELAKFWQTYGVSLLNDPQYETTDILNVKKFILSSSLGYGPDIDPNPILIHSTLSIMFGLDKLSFAHRDARKEQLLTTAIEQLS